MDLDALLEHYFGGTDLDTVDPDALDAGCERLTIDFGIEREAGRRFALWTLMEMIGIAPDPESAFKGERERAAARRFRRIAQ